MNKKNYLTTCILLLLGIHGYAQYERVLPIASKDRAEAEGLYGPSYFRFTVNDTNKFSAPVSKGTPSGNLLRANEKSSEKQQEVELQKLMTRTQKIIGRHNWVMFFLTMLILFAVFFWYHQLRKTREQKLLRQRIRETEKELKTAIARLHGFIREVSGKPLFLGGGKHLEKKQCCGP